MEAFKIYQQEKYSFEDNEDNVDSATIESWEDCSAVVLYGIDGNTLFESSIDKINDDEYPSWVEPFLKAIGLL
jgi:hypothetical protein